MDRVRADIMSVISKRELLNFMRDSSVFVTGATGLLGSMLIKTFLAANEEYGLGISITGQIRNPEKAKNIFGRDYDKINFVTDCSADCDYIIHTASPTASKFFIENPVETIRTAVEGTTAVLELAKEKGATVVYLSSMEEYGVPYEPGQIMTEDKVGIIDHLSVRSSYPESKRLCECLCVSYASEYGTDARIARLAQTFGAGQPLTDRRMPMQFAGAAVKGENIILHTEGKSLSNFVYLTDAIRGILTILKNGQAGEAYNIANDRETRSVMEIAELVASDVAGGRIGVEKDIDPNAGFAPDVNMYLCSDKLRSLGWEAEVSMSEAYSRLAEYIKENE